MTPRDIIAIGYGVCEVAAPRADGSCTCRLGTDCPSQGKHPVGRDWLRIAVGRRSRVGFRVPTRVDLAPKASYGLIPMPGSGNLVLDVDDPAVLVHLPIPHTFSVTRPSAPAGRGHHYLRIPDGIAEADVPRAFAGGEVRVAGSGFVVGPDCRHASGDLYVPNRADVAYATPELIDALRALKPVRRGPEGEVEAVEGNRHAWLVGQARKMAGWGWDLDRIAESLRELNETVCVPPLDERVMEPERMAAWAARNVPRDRGVSVRRSRSPRTWEVVRNG